MLIASVEVAWTTPFTAKSVPFCVPKPNVVVVAFVKSALVAERTEAKSVDDVALVAWSVEEK